MGILDAPSVPPNRQVNAGNGLAGGGDLKANRIIALSIDPKFNFRPEQRWRIWARNLNSAGGNGANMPTTAPNSQTSRSLYSCNGTTTQLKVLVSNFSGISPGTGFGNEFSGPNRVIYTAALEYPTGVLSRPFTFNGSTQVAVDTTGPGSLSDAIGVSISANSQVGIRLFQRAAAAPTNPAATLASGGTLVVGTAYYYFITTFDTAGVESGPTASATITPTSGNQSAVITWTRDTYGASYKIYRSTTNTATSAQLIGTVLDPFVSFTDNGTLTSIAINPPIAQRQALNNQLSSGNSVNSIAAGGNGSDQTLATGNLTSVVGNFIMNGVVPGVILSDSTDIAALLCIGDSRPQGTAIRAGGGVYGVAERNWFNRAVLSGKFTSANASIGGTRIESFINQAVTSVRQRLWLMPYCDYLLNTLGINDLGAGTTWQQLALYHLTFARLSYNMGKRYVNATLSPQTSSTNNFLTASNQSLGSQNADRISFNNWVRNGWRFDNSGTPVLTGGTQSKFFYSYLEIANLLEVNSSNVLTQDGGYNLAATSSSFTGLQATGTPTTTSISVSGTPFTTNALDGQVIVFTSGAANGQSAKISANTSNTITLIANGGSYGTGVTTPVVGLTATPAAGDTFDIRQTYIDDGLHYTSFGANYIGTAISPILDAMIVVFNQ